MKPPLRIASIDDHPLVLEGIRQILRQAGYEIVEPIPHKEQLMGWLASHKVDAVTLDIGMPGLNGIELCRKVKATLPQVSVIIVTQQTDRAYLRAALQAGALGFVSKQAAGTDLIEAVLATSKGRIYISPHIMDGSVNSRAELKRLLDGRSEILSARQRTLLEHVAEGLTMKEIALAMAISVKTVEFHKRALVEVLGVSTTAELTKYAIAHGYAQLHTDPAYVSAH